MDLNDVLGSLSRQDATSRSALETAKTRSFSNDAVSQTMRQILAWGIDGAGPFDPAVVVAERALKNTEGDIEAAVASVTRNHVVSGGIGGFVTGLGGFVTMAVTIPANVIEFYIQAARMVGAVAVLRGYDVDDEHVRTAVLVTLIESSTDERLQQATEATGTDRFAAGVLAVGKAVGFAGNKAFAKLGRAIPFLGGGIGATLDSFMMNRIANKARVEFPQRSELDLAQPVIVERIK